MTEELSLREIINLVILFFIKFKLLIISITFIGFLSMIIFEKNKPEYFSTIAIATSGISEFERIYDSKEEMNQRTAINLINNLQLDILKEDFILVSEKLNILVDEASLIKSIIAAQIINLDQDGKEHNTPKFSIELTVKDNEIISRVQKGLIYFFNTNKYISRYHNKYKETSQIEVESISKEVVELKRLRGLVNSDLDMSTMSIYSNKKVDLSQNQIIELIQHRTANLTNQLLLEPLSFVQGFSKSRVPHTDMLFLSFVTILISFLIAIIIAIFVNVNQIFNKN
ncbi:MAG: hypothetical protein ACKVJW_04900 [Flavobacteriales bacterium]|jgi:hypothetical protein|tara:strand:- start:1615 stop:2466 length:852 start_codon:yes stop_codon:yes gene_type:complete